MLHTAELCELPLHMAAYAGDEKKVGMLITAGYDINMQSYKGFTPLHMALCDEQDVPQKIEK